jgi:hypothetical protein
MSENITTLTDATFDEVIGAVRQAHSRGLLGRMVRPVQA